MEVLINYWFIKHNKIVSYYRKMDAWNVQPFLFKAMERNAVRNEWVKYWRNFEYIIEATGKKDRTRIKNIFLAKAGPDVQEAFYIHSWSGRTGRRGGRR